MKKRSWLRDKVATLRESLSPPPSHPATPRTSFSRDRLRGIFPSRASRDAPRTPLAAPSASPPPLAALPHLSPRQPSASRPPVATAAAAAAAAAAATAAVLLPPNASTPPATPPRATPPVLNTPPPSPSHPARPSDPASLAAVAAGAALARRRSSRPVPPANPETLRRLGSRGPVVKTLSAATSPASAGGATGSPGDSLSRAGSGSGGARSGRTTPPLTDDGATDPRAMRLLELGAYQRAAVEPLSSLVPLRGGSPPDTPSGPGMHAPHTTFAVQRYLVGVDAVLKRRDDQIGTHYVLVPPPELVDAAAPASTGKQESFLQSCTRVAFEVDTTSGIVETFHVRARDDTLLHVTRAAGARVAELRDGSLFKTSADASVLGRVHDFKAKQLLVSFAPDRELLPEWPRLEMRQIASDGDHVALQLAVASEHERVVGHVDVLRHFYDVRVWDSSKAEAVLWIAIVLAAGLDPKRR